MHSNHALSTHLSIWLTIPSVELYLSFSHPQRYDVSQFIVEFALFASLGAAQWRMAKRHWLGSLLCVGAFPLALAVLRQVPEDALTQIFYLAGGGLLLLWPLRKAVNWVEDRRGGREVVALSLVFALLGTATNAAVVMHDQVRGLSERTWGTGSSFWSLFFKRTIWPLEDEPLPTGSSNAPPIILVIVDTLRADDALEMETHRWFRERGRWWPSAMSTSSWTLPSVASIQTGMLPEQHGATCLYEGHCQGVRNEVPTLAEDLAASGYRTIALTTNPWVSDREAIARGYQQVFDYASSMPIELTFSKKPNGPERQDASVLVDATLQILEQTPESGYLIWLHLIDPHMPYTHTPDSMDVSVKSLRSTSVSNEQRTKLRDAYRLEVAHVDKELMRLIHWLEEDGFFERGVLVLASDHGEEFWEHGGFEHGHSHHAEVVEVPLAIAGLGVTPGKDSGLASLIDIAPTVRAIAGLDENGTDLRMGTSVDRILSAQGVLLGPLIRSARDDTTRVIVRGDESFEPLSLQRYDLIADPQELASSPPSADDPVAQAALALTEPAAGEVLPVNQEALRALGYIE